MSRLLLALLILVSASGCLNLSKTSRSASAQALVGGAATAEVSGPSSGNCVKGNATLGWDAVNDGALAGYRLHYGAISGQYVLSIDAGRNTSVTVPNLSRGTWYFAVAAYDATGAEGEFSNEASFTCR
jgi:hypothetical protein